MRVCATLPLDNVAGVRYNGGMNSSPMRKRMKVAVKVVFSVDPDAWRDEFGSQFTNPEIREAINNDVREAAAYAFRQVMDAVELEPQI